jgi:hypothetical protein
MVIPCHCLLPINITIIIPAHHLTKSPKMVRLTRFIKLNHYWLNFNYFAHIFPHIKLVALFRNEPMPFSRGVVVRAMGVD